MSDALGLECLHLSEELAELSARTDAAKAEAEARLRALADTLSARVGELRAAMDRDSDARRVALAARTHAVLAVIERVQATVTVEAPPGELPRDLVAELGAACSDLAAALREAPPPPIHRPANHVRSLTHVTFGTVTLGLIDLLPSQRAMILASGAFALFAWTLELTRARSPWWNAVLMKILGPIAHPHEWRRVNSSTWYGTGLFVIALLCTRPACAVGVAVLALGDPMAGFVGRRWGRIHIRHGRSLEGSTAFVLAGTIAAMGALAVFHPVALSTMATLALVGALAGALAEIVSTRLDDNFTIPVAAALAVSAFGLR